MVVVVDAANNPFVKPMLQSMRAIERDIIRLYAESCYTNIQAAFGNLSGMERMERLADAVSSAEQRCYALKARLRRIGVPQLAISGLTDQQRLSLFEEQFKRCAPALSMQQISLDRQQLCSMLEDISNRETAD